MELGINIARNWNRLEKSQDERDFTNYSSFDTLNIIGKPLTGFTPIKLRDIIKTIKTCHVILLRKTYLGTVQQFYRAGIASSSITTGMDASIMKTGYFGGSPLPLVSGGIINMLNYKGFDVNILFNYVIGRHILNQGPAHPWVQTG
ncbi:MAG: hypothetical protein V8R91_08000 [Butyricimonas faecihominis]